MSLADWNKGLDDAYFGLEPNMKGSADYWDGFLYGDAINSRYANCPPQPIQPEPTAEDLCDGWGHPYYGSDEIGPRCYCGQRTEFTAEEIAAKKL